MGPTRVAIKRVRKRRKYTKLSTTRVLPRIENLTLIECGAEFSTLRLKLELMYESQRKEWPGETWTELVEEEWDKALAPIRDRLAQLRVAVVKHQATTLPELQTKATILLDLVEGDSEDIVTRLTSSLCQDVIDLTAEAKSPIPALS